MNRSVSGKARTRTSQTASRLRRARRPVTHRTGHEGGAVDVRRCSGASGEVETAQRTSQPSCFRLDALWLVAGEQGHDSAEHAPHLGPHEAR